MKAVIQRVRDASVSVDGAIAGQIEKGMLVYFGVDESDDISMLQPFLEKLVRLRIFEDENGKMNLSLDKDSMGILFISQFTLAADLSRGNRPDFAHAMNPSVAEKIYAEGISILKNMGYNVQCGVFGAHMVVSYSNLGPVTFILDSRDMKCFQKKV